MKKSLKKELRESFLKQIEDYNDFIVQNDLDVDPINIDHDYDFSAFETPADWAVETERVADKLSDRKIEIKQNEDAGEFAGMELENGMPSYEAVKNMSDEEFSEYEEKFLTPANDVIEPPAVDTPEAVEVAVPESVAPIAPVEASAFDTKVTDVNATVPLAVGPDQNKTDPLDINTSAEQNPAPKGAETEYEFSLPLAWELFKGTHPGIKNGIDTVKSVGKVIDQGQPVNALQDAGRGVMRGLAGTTGSIADLGGLVPNRVADMAHKSSDWWKDQYEIVDSEAGSIGDALGTEAVAGVTGGVAGKGIGKAYQGMKHGGEALRKRATTVAKDTEKRAKQYGESPLDAAISRQSAYENMTNVPPRKSMLDAILGTEPQFKRSTVGDAPYAIPLTPWDKAKKFHTEKLLDQGSRQSRTYDMDNVFEPTSPRGTPAMTRMFDTALHNAQRKLGDRGMLKSNDAELESMFNRGTPLDDALKMRQKQWDKIPMQGVQTGTALGLAGAQ